MRWNRSADCYVYVNNDLGDPPPLDPTCMERVWIIPFRELHHQALISIHIRR